MRQEEPNVSQEDMDVFPALAEDLQLKNLAGIQSETLDQKDPCDRKKSLVQLNIPKPTMKNSPKNEIILYALDTFEINIAESLEESDTKSWEISSSDLTNKDLETKKTL